MRLLTTNCGKKLKKPMTTFRLPQLSDCRKLKNLSACDLKSLFIIGGYFIPVRFIFNHIHKRMFIFGMNKIRVGSRFNQQLCNTTASDFPFICTTNQRRFSVSVNRFDPSSNVPKIRGILLFGNFLVAVQTRYLTCNFFDNGTFF